MNQTIKNGPQAKVTFTHLRDGEILGVEEVGNIVTNVGLATIHKYAYATPAQREVLGTGFNWVALSNDANPPDAADTALGAELTQHGLARAQGTVLIASPGSNVTVVENTFTFTGAEQTVRKAALFDTSTGGRMAHEVLFPGIRVLRTNDTLRVKFTITLGE